MQDKGYHDYYKAGAHIYEFPRGRGRRRAVIAFEETPQGDGKMLWEEHNGLAEYQATIREDA